MRDMNINLEPFHLSSLLEYRGKQKENTHGTVSVRGRIQSDRVDEYQQMAMEVTNGKVYAVDEAGEQTVILNGVFRDIEIEYENNSHVLSCTLVTETYLMDHKPHTRTFQNTGLANQSLLSTVTAGYNNSSVIACNGDKPIGVLLVQYQETDWEFALRHASKENTCLFPETGVGGAKFYFGLPQRNKEIVIEEVHYAVKKNAEEYLYKTRNGLADFREQDATYTIIKSRELYELGDTVILNGRELYISQFDSLLTGSELIHTYYLKPLAGVRQPQFYNSRIIGASLAAHVTEVFGDQVYITIPEDENAANSGVIALPYSTPYSSPDGTGFYAMPEVGDRVRLYFPTRHEEQGYVISAVHLDSTNSDLRCDPNTKYIRNKEGKEVRLTPTALKVTNNDDMTIEIDDEKGIIITSGKAVVIQSDEAISVTSERSTLQVIGKEAVQLSQAGNAVTLQDAIQVSGNKVNVQAEI